MDFLHKISVVLLMIFTVSCYGAVPPLYKAIEDEDLWHVRALIGAGAILNAHDFDGRTVLTAAIGTGSYSIVKELLDAGANINAPDSYGWTPLHHAALLSKSNIVKTLIERGANINTRDNNGATPLHMAAFAGSLNIVKALIAAGATINAQNLDGDTAVQLAIKSGHYDVADYIDAVIQRIQNAQARTRQNMRVMTQVQHPRLGAASPAGIVDPHVSSMFGDFLSQAEEYDALQPQ